ncbi:Transcription factor Ken 1, partial [Gryllus bimaculatus]
MEETTILAANIIKREDVKEEQDDSIEECKLNCIVKQEPDDEAEEQKWTFREEGETSSVKGKEEKDDDEEEELELPVRVVLKEEPIDDIEQEHEEELKPPQRVFVDPEEASDAEGEQEHEDPLAMCNENSVRGACSVGGECDTARRHQCAVCQKAFSVRKHLMRHMRIHSGERPHECSVCQKRFAQKVNLIRHMGIHSERPQECSRSMEEAARLQEQESERRLQESLRLQEQRAAAALREAVGRMERRLQERDAAGRALAERVRRLEARVAALESGGQSALSRLERRTGRLEEAVLRALATVFPRVEALLAQLEKAPPGAPSPAAGALVGQEDDRQRMERR